MKVSFCSKFQRVVWVAHLELLSSSSHQGEMAQNILEGCVFSEVREQTGALLPPPSLLQALGRCPRNAPLLQSLFSPVLLVSSGPFTCFPPLTSVLPTSTFPLLPSFLTSSALALSFKSVPLFSHPPMPFCLLASPLVH